MLKLVKRKGRSCRAWKHIKRSRPPSSSSSKLNSAHITKLHSYTPKVPHTGAKRGERLLLPCLQNLHTSYNSIQLSFRNHDILKEAAGLWICRISPQILPWLAALQLRLALTRQMFSLNPSEPNLSGPAEFKFNPSKTKELHKDLLCSRKCY